MHSRFQQQMTVTSMRGSLAEAPLDGPTSPYKANLCFDTHASAGGVDESQLAVMGGSHGGLLTGHLVGQHPERFRCASLRNPVMDVSAMIHLSDIPDWCVPPWLAGCPAG